MPESPAALLWWSANSEDHQSVGCSTQYATTVVVPSIITMPSSDAPARRFSSTSALPARNCLADIYENCSSKIAPSRLQRKLGRHIGRLGLKLTPAVRQQRGLEARWHAEPELPCHTDWRRTRKRNIDPKERVRSVLFPAMTRRASWLRSSTIDRGCKLTDKRGT